MPDEPKQTLVRPGLHFDRFAPPEAKPKLMVTLWLDGDLAICSFRCEPADGEGLEWDACMAAYRLGLQAFAPGQPRRPIEDAVNEAERLLAEAFSEIKETAPWLLARLTKIREALADRRPSKAVGGSAVGDRPPP